MTDKSRAKYSDLPGIAYDQPDVYETTDLPEADQVKPDQQGEDNDIIERLHVSPTEAYSKFKGKTLTSEDVDFSDRVSQRRQTGYKVLSEWEIAGRGEKETPLQKYQRLKCETKELVEELASLRDDESKEMPNSVIMSHLDAMNRQLEDIRLDQTFGSALVSNLADEQGTQIKKMLTELEKLAVVPEQQPRGSQQQEPQGQPLEIKYKLSSRPHHAQMLEAARIADLDARVNRLNNLVASSPDALRRLSGISSEKSLVEACRLVASKVALLDTSQLDAVESRTTSLLSKLDQLAEKSAEASTDLERDSKIRELYEMSKSWGETSAVLPRVVDRMVALETLHKQGSNVMETVSQLEAAQTTIERSVERITQSLKKIQSEMPASVDSVRQKLEHIDSRIKLLLESKQKK